jgi:3-hydroxybutyryl-CoA dehydratase
MSFPKELTPIKKSVDKAQVLAYAEASGDYNPIHIDEKFAAETPFGRTIAHGMLILSFIAEMMTSSFGETWLKTGKLKIRFKAPVFVGDTVYTFGSMASTESDGNGDTQSYSVGCKAGDGTVYIIGKATVQLS